MNSFFIAGAQRSGTTLLSVMLSRHPEIHLDSSSVTFRLVSCFKNYEKVLPYNLEHIKEEVLSWLIENDYKGRLKGLIDLSKLNETDNIKELIEQSITRKLHDENKSIFGDKAPNIEQFVADLLLLIPNAKFIHIVRDGRGAALSKAKRAHKNLYLAAQEWVDSNIKGLANQAMIGESQYKIIKYEDLLLNPEKELQDVCRFLDIAYDSVLLAGEASGNDTKSYVSSTLETSKIDAFRSELNQKQIARIEKIQAPLLKKFNYKLLCPPSNKKYRQLSVGAQIWFNQMDSVKQLFISKRIGMVKRENIEVHIPLKSRVKTFVFEIGRDFFPEKVFTRVFRRAWISNVYLSNKKKKPLHQDQRPS